MRAIITIFKVELEHKAGVFIKLKEMSDEILGGSDAYVISPNPGQLFNILNELKNNFVNYGTHFNTAEPPAASI